MAANGSVRFKLTLLMIGLALLEGGVKTIFKAFPLTEVFSIQGVVFGGFMAVRTISNMDEAKYANGVLKEVK
jgi:hypothetical protein